MRGDTPTSLFFINLCVFPLSLMVISPTAVLEMETKGTITDIHDLFNMAESTQKLFGTEAWWRGQADVKWGLTPHVYRQDRPLSWEQTLAARFVVMAPARYTRCPDHRDWRNWLFLMQHYRLPTRLLDWTESILIAAYFAVVKYPEEPAALWALNLSVLNELQVNKGALMSPGNPETKALFNAPFDRTAEKSDKIVAVMTNQIDPRMMVQLSGFTIHGSREPLDNLAKNEQFLAKYEILAKSKAKIKDQLGMVGIMEANLFPDLDHLASDLASRTYKL
ncbi:MAG: FRG domain-containing protein [Deltaproteobacteria bacterium]|nr:FRG domain-containing protein [Deltaproteobacteria bacterium]